MIDGPDDGKVSVAFTFLEGLKEHKIIHTAHPFMMKNKEVIEYVINTLQN
jgi:triacylglycerol lipase